jgi:hypothetical protein
MMSLEELKATLVRVAYKPGWSFRLWESRWEGVCMAIRFQAPNAYSSEDDPGRNVGINVKTFVPPCPDENYFLAFLAYRLSRIELHEMREFLKVDGVCLDDPHAEGANDEFRSWDE